MDVLLDTNILARSIEPAHPHHHLAKRATEALLSRGDRLCIVPQVLYEYFVVCTRPQQENGGLGMSNAGAISEITRLESLFHLVTDSAAIYPAWLDLIGRYSVLGKRAHDARIVAAMIVAQVPAILTFNLKDFRRYGEISVVDPAELSRT